MKNTYISNNAKGRKKYITPTVGYGVDNTLWL